MPRVAKQANACSIEDEARRPIEEKEEVLFDNNEDEGVGVSETMDNVDDVRMSCMRSQVQKFGRR